MKTQYVDRFDDPYLYKSSNVSGYRMANCCKLCVESFYTWDARYLICAVDIPHMVVLENHICDKFKNKEE
jgi:hypothetical protein